MARKTLNPSQKFAQNVKTFCEKKGINHADVTEAVGKSRNYLNKIARGESTVNLDAAQAIADQIGVYVSELLEEGSMDMKRYFKK